MINTAVFEALTREKKLRDMLRYLLDEQGYLHNYPNAERELIDLMETARIREIEFIIVNLGTWLKELRDD